MRLLAERETGGILVRLIWDERAAPEADVLVRYRGLRSGQSFFVRPPRARALHAFYHPNALAAAPQATSGPAPDILASS